MNDELILKQAQRGDIDAFEQLARKYQGKLYGLCLRLMKNEFDAADAAQEALLKIYQGLRTFSGRSSFGTWAYALTKNVCLDQLRKKKMVLENIDDKLDLADGEFDPPAVCLQNEDAREIRRMLEELPREQSSVLVLREIDGYSYGEIAELLGISPGTVRSRLARGRQKLRALLLEYKSNSRP